MSNLNKSEKDLLEKILAGEISSYSNLTRTIQKIRNKLSHDTYKSIFEKIPEFKLDENIIEGFLQQEADEILEIYNQIQNSKNIPKSKDFKFLLVKKIKSLGESSESEYLSWSPIRRLMKHNGAIIVAQAAVDELVDWMEISAEKITKNALTLTRHSKRKKVTRADILLAIKYFK